MPAAHPPSLTALDGLVARLQSRVPEMVEALRRLVEAESPSSHVAACDACAEEVEKLALLTVRRAAERVVADGRTHLRWSFGERSRVLLIGHLDTVWPLGTLARRPFAVSGDRATGPGVFDMKAGIVQLFFALAELEERHGLDGVAVLVTSDEEIGSPTSKALIETSVRGIDAALVLEPSAGGALKTERKGTALYRVEAHGRSAHAGLDPEKGANAVLEIAAQLPRIAALASPDAGTTITPTLVSGGTASNVVPAEAQAHIDVRTRTARETERVEAALASLQPVNPEVTLAVEREQSVPPLERRSSERLFARAELLAGMLGLPPPAEAAVGGGSDGNLIASYGVSLLDGLGAVGDFAHGEDEFVSIPAMPQRAALVCALAVDALAVDALA